MTAHAVIVTKTPDGRSPGVETHCVRTEARIGQLARHGRLTADAFDQLAADATVPRTRALCRQIARTMRSAR